MTYINKDLQEKFGFPEGSGEENEVDHRQRPPKHVKLASVPKHAKAAVLPKTRKRPFYKQKLIYVVTVILLIIIWQPVANWYTVARASPAQKALADSLSLTNRGRVIFLATKPGVLDTNSFASACPSSGNGDLEEGCYLPAVNRLYIRAMPDELKSDEAVTAAHEMLHAAYQKYDDSERAQVNSMVEDQYSSMSDSELTGRVAEYNKIEPGNQDAELYAILGTEYGYLSPALENEYSKYFNNRQLEVGDAAQTKGTFDNYVSQLDNLKNIINNEQSLADRYYNTSVLWANDGNAYEDYYYYNLYSNEYNNASRDIGSYNSLVNKYNLLIDEYSGKVYTPLTPNQKNGQ